MNPAPSWDLGHLRLGWLVMAAAGGIGIPIFGWQRGAVGALSFAGSLVLVGVFFSLSALAVSKAGKVADALTMPVALAMYVLKVVVLGILLGALGNAAWIDVPALVTGIVGGTIAWLVVHAFKVATSRIYYVDPANNTTTTS